MIVTDCPFCTAGIPPAIHKHYIPLRDSVTKTPIGDTLVLSDHVYNMIMIEASTSPSHDGE